jgi:hypothetical protein
VPWRNWPRYTPPRLPGDEQAGEGSVTKSSRLSTGLALTLGMGVLAGLAAGCTVAGQGTPTPPAEDVIRTAEAMAEQTRQAASPTPSPTLVTPTATFTPVTPTVAVTPTPAVSGPVVTADYPVTVRVGPGETYVQVDLMLTGQMARVVGRYDDTPIGTWYLLQRVEVGKDGWVWSGAVTIVGDPALIPVVTPVVTPAE